MKNNSNNLFKSGLILFLFCLFLVAIAFIFFQKKQFQFWRAGSEIELEKELPEKFLEKKTDLQSFSSEAQPKPHSTSYRNIKSMPAQSVLAEVKISQYIAMVENIISENNIEKINELFEIPVTQNSYLSGLVLGAFGQLGRQLNNDSVIENIQDRLYGYLILATDNLNAQSQGNALQALQSLSQVGRSVEQLDFLTPLSKCTQVLGTHILSMLIALKDSRAFEISQTLLSLVNNNRMIASLIEDNLEKEDTIQEIKRLQITLKNQ